MCFLVSAEDFKREFYEIKITFSTDYAILKKVFLIQ